MRGLDRRRWMQAVALGALGAGSTSWAPLLARQLADSGSRRHCVLLWMTGGPSQMDTFDLKPQHANGGEFKPIETSVPGMQISEHLPNLARQAEHLAIIRGVSTKEGDHGRATYLVHTGYGPGTPVRYPAIGSALSHELGSDEAEVPNYVSITPYQAFNRAAFSPGYLGPRFAPLNVQAAPGPQNGAAQSQFAELKVEDLRPTDPSSMSRLDRRLEMWQHLQEGFLSRHPEGMPRVQDTAYHRAVRMMRSAAARAFDLSEESDSVRAAYGKGRFGQGCLLARRLIESGVPFVEVTLGGLDENMFGWDTHLNNFATVKQLCGELDAGWSALMRELAERGLLESTTILWAGEFGRTPAINQNGGRDHFPNAWTTVLAGGGIRGGQVYGRTSDDGMTVEEGKVGIGDVLATFCNAAGVDPQTQLEAELGRPIRIADGKPIQELAV